MTADLLREAAALMRQRAQAATPSPWVSNANLVGVPNLVDLRRKPATFLVAHTDERDSNAVLRGVTQHVASWHPTVALAVADWLDVVAEYGEPDKGRGTRNWDAALTVARAYLGRDAGGVPVSDTLRDRTPPDQGCKVPPPGWWCSREPGHEPPCAARPQPDFPPTGDLAARCRHCGAKPGEWCKPDCDAEQPQHPEETVSDTLRDRTCECDLTEEEYEGHDCLVYAWEHQAAAMALFSVASQGARAAQERITAALALHVEAYPGAGWCAAQEGNPGHGGEHWPCATRRALTGEA